MILINNKEVDLTQDTPWAKKISREINTLKKQFKLPVTIKIPDGQDTYNVTPNQYNSSGKAKRMRNRNIKLNEIFVDNSGSYHVRYCTSYHKGEDANTRYHPYVLTLKYKMEIKDYEQLWFLAFMSKKCSNSLGVPDDQISNVPYFTIEQKEMEARSFIDREKHRAEAEYLLLSENSPLTAQMLKFIAKNYNIADVEKSEEDVLRAQIIKTLRANKNASAYREFLRISRGEDASKVREIVYDAINLKVMAHDKEGDWYFVADDGSFTEKICDNFGSKDKQSNIIDFLYCTRQVLDQVKTVISVVKERGEKKDDTNDIVCKKVAEAAIDAGVIGHQNEAWYFFDGDRAKKKITDFLPNQKNDQESLLYWMAMNPKNLKSVEAAMKKKEMA